MATRKPGPDPVPSVRHGDKVVYFQEYRLTKKGRSGRKLTQQEVADRMNVAKSTVSKLESGDLPPTAGYIVAYAAAIGEPPEALFSKPSAGTIILRGIPPELTESLKTIVAQYMRRGGSA